jgi:hypothetical protein
MHSKAKGDLAKEKSGKKTSGGTKKTKTSSGKQSIIDSILAKNIHVLDLPDIEVPAEHELVAAKYNQAIDKFMK